MSEYSVEIRPPEKMDLTITGAASQQITLKPGEFQKIIFDYDGDYLIFQGKKVNSVASLRCISDVFWMILSLSAKGFKFRPNEPLELLKKLKL